MYKMIAVLTVASLIAACTGNVGGPPPGPVFGGTYSQSIGFTGIGTEPF